jgi:glycosyltransferase involved in cell wall biosynthesis
VVDWDDYWEGSSIYGNYEIMKKYVAFCEQKAPGFFKNMVVVSDFLKKKAEDRGALYVLKLINAVNTEQFKVHKKQESRKKLGLSQNGKYLITFGNTYINDRALLLFKVFEKILNKVPQVKLMFNLDAKKIIEEEKIGDKINSKILDNIITVGNISQEDQGYYLSAADAVIFIMGDGVAERPDAVQSVVCLRAQNRRVVIFGGVRRRF